jgi:MtrB/PioB family decaheme-associated outer membrane protein
LYNYTVGTGSAVMSDAGIKNILALPLALPPDNQAHQFYLAGNYAFTPTTRATFKYAYTHATQDDTFPSVFTPPPGVSNLGGEVNTQLAQLGISARPMPKLSLLANVRYEDKEDKTPIAYYNVEGDPTILTNWFTNNPSSRERLFGKVEGSYQLAPNYNLTLGVDYETIDRSLPVSTTEVAGLTYLRENTDEISYRAELRHNLSETLNGSISYINSQRDGSDLYTASTGLIVPYSTITTNQGVPSYLANRDREKWRLLADWTPSDRLSFQLMLEEGSDSADTGAGIRGWRNTDFGFYSIDVSYAISENWKLSAYASHGKQTLRVNHSTTSYQVNLDDINDTAGIDLKGKLSAQLEVGANLSYTRDKNRYEQLQTSPAGSVPDVLYRVTQLKLYGKYAMNKQSSVRLDLAHQDAKLDEWTWTGFTYSDGTSVSLQPNQQVTFVGASYSYKWK